MCDVKKVREIQNNYEESKQTNNIRMEIYLLFKTIQKVSYAKMNLLLLRSDILHNLEVNFPRI